MSGTEHDIEYRARAAAAGLRHAATRTPPEFSAVVRAGRMRTVARVAAALAGVMVLAAIGFAAGSVADPTSLRWITGAVLLVLLAAAWLLCAHAGGHALFVPLPALALAILWAVTVPGLHGGTAWWLVAMSAAAAGLGGLIGTTALRQQLRSSTQPRPSLAGATGRALTALTPSGVVQVASESWSAVSVSGPLPAGAVVHVAGTEGMRLRVWSEAGVVLDERTLQDQEEEK
jgi:membrane-bound ClpP family serine protease